MGFFHSPAMRWKGMIEGRKSDWDIAKERLRGIERDLGVVLEDITYE